MVEVRYCDAAGAMRVWVNAYPGLCGKGNPLANGVHLGKPRSASTGAVAGCQEITPRVTGDDYDDVRLSFTVRSVGSEAGARAAAERACRALANAVTTGLRGNPATVTTQEGDLVRLLYAHSPQGPTFTGDVGGEAEYRFDATVRCQPG
jgi:hypothetical protein